MSTVTAVRKMWFCAGHRVLNHESKCRNLHGHNYIVKAHAEAQGGLDKLGRVIDFSVIKEQLNSWIDSHWDHTTLLYKEDEQLIAVAPAFEATKQVFICDWNPTAENMALYLLNEICPALFQNTGVQIVKIELWETENCHVVVKL